MLFSGIPFLYYFLPLLLILFFVCKNTKYRQWVLIVFSLVFYAWGVGRYILLMLGMVAFNYAFGFIVRPDEEGESKPIQKLYVTIAVIVNLGVLGFFKYTGFFVENVNAIFGLSLPGIDIAIPIGISFYTFQAMSYVIDIYRGVTPVQRSFPKLLLYVSLFPQLVAGPIVRYQDIEAQLDNLDISLERVNDGAFKFAVGLAKKMLLANGCGDAAECLFSMSGDITLLARWAGALFYTLQIYYDFSGYSDMAIGLGKIFGFDFRENFDYPYASRNVTEFWRRWHISLGTWFKDYLFYPVLRSRLIGKINSHLMHKKHRKAAQRITTIIALFCVWSLTGLWHGASWNFVLWGIYYFILLVAEMLFLQKFFDILPAVLSKIIQRIYFCLATVFGMAIFYFETDLRKNLGLMLGIGVDKATNLMTETLIAGDGILLIVSIIFAFPVVPLIFNKLREKNVVTPVTERILKTVVTVVFLILGTVFMVGNTYNPFLYFRF